MTRSSEGLVTAIRLPELAGVTLGRGACLALGPLLARGSALDRLIFFVKVHGVVLLQQQRGWCLVLGVIVLLGIPLHGGLGWSI
jgi:hypothetical protein